MRSARFTCALEALHGEALPFVLGAAIRANKADNEIEDEKYGSDTIVHFDIEEIRSEADDSNKVLQVLRSLRDPFVDALCIVMYAGRDEFMDGHPYDELDTDAQFSDWWDYLGMDGEHYAREQMSEKVPLARYLRRGAYMFHIDMDVVA